MIPVIKEKFKVKHALANPAGTPIILVNEIADISPLVVLKIIKILSM